MKLCNSKSFKILSVIVIGIILGDIDGDGDAQHNENNIDDESLYIMASFGARKDSFSSCSIDFGNNSKWSQTQTPG